MEWEKVVIGQEYRSPLILDEDDNNTLIVDAVFHDFTGDAITLGNVSNVYIKDCTIYDIDGNGVVFRSTRGTDHITIDGCTIHDTTRNGIIAKQDPAEGIDHIQLVIKNNTLRNNGTNELDHGLYIQAQDARIENNQVINSSGNGISIRSSGVIRGNTVRDSNKSCIRYFSDNSKGPSNTLLIENNICTLSLAGSESPAFSLLVSSDSPPHWMVDEYIIRFNTIAIFTGERAGIEVESPEFAPKDIQVYGNIVVNTRDATRLIEGEHIDYYSSNLVTTKFVGFVDTEKPPYDLHLSPWSAAVNYASQESRFPVYDADGETRNAGQLDAGAYQLTRNTYTFLMQRGSYAAGFLLLIGLAYLAIIGGKKRKQRNATPPRE